MSVLLPASTAAVIVRTQSDPTGGRTKQVLNLERLAGPAAFAVHKDCCSIAADYQDLTAGYRGGSLVKCTGFILNVL